MNAPISRRRDRPRAHLKESGMPCMWVIFIVVGVGVWILVTVFRKAEEERQKNLPRQGGDGARGPVRRSGTDLDRFLDEARRRRDAGERRSLPPMLRGPCPSPSLHPGGPATSSVRRPLGVREKRSRRLCRPSGVRRRNTVRTCRIGPRLRCRLPVPLFPPWCWR